MIFVNREPPCPLSFSPLPQAQKPPNPLLFRSSLYASDISINRTHLHNKPNHHKSLYDGAANQQSGTARTDEPGIKSAITRRGMRNFIHLQAFLHLANPVLIKRRVFFHQMYQMTENWPRPSGSLGRPAIENQCSVPCEASASCGVAIHVSSPVHLVGQLLPLEGVRVLRSDRAKSIWK